MKRKPFTVLPGVLYIFILISYSCTLPATAQALRMYVGPRSLFCQATIDIPVRVDNFSNVLSVSGTLKWERDDLNFIQLVSTNPAFPGFGQANFNVQNTENGFLGFDYSNPNEDGINLSNGTFLFIVRMGIKKPESGNSNITFTDDIYPVRFTNPENELLDFSTASADLTIVKEIENYNPFSSELFSEGEKKMLDGGAGFQSYLWNTGETTRTIEVSSSGVFTVKVINEQGCEGEATTIVNIGPLTAVLISEKDGDWDNPATWEGGFIPISSTSVIIRNQINVSANRACKSIVAEPNAKVHFLSGVFFRIFE